MDKLDVEKLQQLIDYADRIVLMLMYVNHPFSRDEAKKLASDYFKFRGLPPVEGGIDNDQL